MLGRGADQPDPASQKLNQTALAHPIMRAGRRGDYFEIRPEAMFEMVRPD